MSLNDTNSDASKSPVTSIDDEPLLSSPSSEYETAMNNLYHKYIINENYNRQLLREISQAVSSRSYAEYQLKLRTKNFEAESKSMMDVIAKQEKEIECYKEEVERFNEEVRVRGSELQRMHDVYEKQHQTVNDLHDENNVLIEDRDHCLEKINQVMAENDELTQTVNTLQNTLKFQNDQLASEHKDMLSALKNQLIEMTAERDASRNEFDKYKQNYEKLAFQRAENAQKIMQTLRENVNLLEEQKSELEDTLKITNFNLNEMEKAVFDASAAAKRAEKLCNNAVAKCNEMESKYNQLLAKTNPVHKIGDNNDCHNKLIQRSTRLRQPSISSSRDVSSLSSRTASPFPATTRRGFPIHQNASHFSGGIIARSSPPPRVRGQSPAEKLFASSLRNTSDASMITLAGSTLKS